MEEVKSKAYFLDNLDIFIELGLLAGTLGLYELVELNLLVSI